MGPDLRQRELQRAAAEGLACCGGGEAAFPPLLPSLQTRGSREPVRSGHPGRPRSGEARPGSPGAGRGGVTAPSARPRGMHRGSRGRRRHSQNWILRIPHETSIIRQTGVERLVCAVCCAWTGRGMEKE